MATRFGVHVHVHKKNGDSVAFAPGDAVPGWAKGKVGDHVPTYDDVEQAQVVDEDLEKAKADATSADVSTEGTVEDIRARIAAKATGGGADLQVTDEQLREQLAAIGQPTEGTTEELQKRLTEHGE